MRSSSSNNCPQRRAIEEPPGVSELLSGYPYSEAIVERPEGPRSGTFWKCPGL